MNREAALRIVSAFPRIPSSTYRLQFHKEFPFATVFRDDIIEYLSQLGITDLYSSPILKARPGSTHGYDVVDHSEINPEIGTEQDFETLSTMLLDRNMGLLLDMVPNHMGVGDPDNIWWMDVLEHGKSSQYANFLDIDWEKPGAQGKLLFPTLGKPLGISIKNGELSIGFKLNHRLFYCKYYSQEYPIDPATYHIILKKVVPYLPSKDDHSTHKVVGCLELSQKIPSHLDTDPHSLGKRAAFTDTIKQKIQKAVIEDNIVQVAIEKALADINSDLEESGVLARLLSNQPYRLAYWKRASDEINYRRFFDINDLMAIRMENPLVYAEAHKLLFCYLKNGRITGLRVDHPDGLYDPIEYFKNLQQSARNIVIEATHVNSPTIARAVEKPLYLLVEKILEYGEVLNPKFEVHGTTGYEYMNHLNGIYVDTNNEEAFRKIYQKITEIPSYKGYFEEILYECKKLIIDTSMESDMDSLARLLESIAQESLDTSDFTYKQLKRTLAEVIACFPVYRTFITPNNLKSISEDDRKCIEIAFQEAQKREKSLDVELFDFVKSILLSGESSPSRVRFIMRFQQTTGPIMAKGLEDTSFYRFFLLSSLNEVGGYPDLFGASLQEFHNENIQRSQKLPHTLLGTSTHDTKRSEDVRARINVLSEIPEEWHSHASKWIQMNEKYKSDAMSGSRKRKYPEPNEEYFLYQTLVGVWPFDCFQADEELKQRVINYMLKASKEAKVHTSWVVPNVEYEKVLTDFIQDVMSNQEFIKNFLPFQQKISELGKWNSLSQTFVKLTSPGVPDIYQGTELWALSLVDPDNRRPVDYKIRRKYLNEMLEMKNKYDGPSYLINTLLKNTTDGKIKMYFIHQILSFRNQNKDIFSKGSYSPLNVSGSQSNNVIAFMREHNGQTIIAVASRFFASLKGMDRNYTGEQIWTNTTLDLPSKSESSFKDILSGESYKMTENSIHVSQLFKHLPFCLLVSQKTERK